MHQNRTDDGESSQAGPAWEGPDTCDGATVPMRRITPPARNASRRSVLTAGVLAVLLVLGIGTAVATVNQGNGEQQAAADQGPAQTLRLGYFGNVTHGPALIGVNRGIFADALENDGTQLQTEVFSTGPNTIEALNAGAIDAAYLGPSPALNSFLNSRGESLKIIAGTASGGAQLVVRPDITSVEQLRGETLATPQLGGTQDVALRVWLKQHGLETTPDGGGDVSINPTENAATLSLFQSGRIAGGWLPEPWASRLVLEAGAKVLVDERDLWDGTEKTRAATGQPGHFTTTILVVNQRFAQEHPQTVKTLLGAHAEAIDWLNDAPEDTQIEALNKALTVTAGKPLPVPVLRRSLEELTFTPDPLAAAFPRLLQDGVDAGVSRPGDLDGLFDLQPLNEVLRERGEPTVSADGLGQE